MKFRQYLFVNIEKKKDRNGEEQGLLVYSILQHVFKLFTPSKLVLNHQERILGKHISPVSFRTGVLSIRAPRNMKKKRSIKDHEEEEEYQG